MKTEHYLTLVELLNRANEAYYKKSEPIMSDEEYDEQMDSLIQFENSNPDLISPDSPTQFVGDDSNHGFKKVKHLHPMLSIAKITEDSEVEKFISETDGKTGDKNFYCCQLKIDGCALSLVYENGNLIRAVTRGNGSTGDDVTNNAMTIQSIPKKIDTPHHRVEIRGECVIFKENFELINSDLKAKGEKTYENARNLVSGSMKLKDSSETAKRKINFIAYSLVEGGTTSQTDDMAQLAAWGFETPVETVTTGNVEHVLASLKMVDRRKHEYKYDIDGVVIKVDDKTKYSLLGGTSKVPHWCKAFKFKPEAGVTTLSSVEYQVGRTGIICPVAVFDPPVRLAGTNVKKATLHNFDEIARLGVGIGDKVFVEKKGEIIPKVTGLAEKSRDSIEIVPPSHCPVCLTGKVEQVNGEVVYSCTNNDCSAKILNRFKHFASKHAMDMFGLAEKTLEQLIDLEIVKDFADLYTLTEKDLTDKVPRMGEKKVENTINAIQSSKNRGLANLLVGLGIPNCGENTCKNLARHFESIDNLSAATESQLEGLVDIGPTTASSIFEWFRNQDNLELIQRLKANGVKMTLEDVQVSSDIFKEKTFVITGTLDNPRKFYVDLIESNGGKVSSSVSKTTSYLLAGADCGSKLEKAEKLGVKIIDEIQFMEMI